MADTTSLVLAVDSRQVRTAASDLDRLGVAGRKTETATQRVTRSFGALRGAVGGVSAVLVARQVIQTADAYANLNARLRLVTKSTLDFEKAQSALVTIANKTRVDLGETVDLYARLARSTEPLGVSQGALLEVTESINKALIVSGTSSAGAAAALMQLGQGFASGTLRGEELNSVLEQTPRLAQAIADGMGVSIGQLRALGQEGKLTAASVFDALRSQRDKLEEEFRKMPITVGQATQQIGNSLSVLIGRIDEATGATKGLAAGLSDISRVINNMANAAAPVNSVARLAEETRRLGVIESLIAKEREKSILSGGLLSGVTIAYYEKQRAEIQKSIKAAEDFQKAQRGAQVGGGRGFVNPAFVVPDAPTKGGGGGGGSRGAVQSEAQRYLESLQRQAEATKDLTAYEEALLAIQKQRLGGLTPALKAQILGSAQLVDQLRAEAEQRDTLADATKREAEEQARMRELASQSSLRATEAAAAEVADIAAGNALMREEIAILAGGEEARRAIAKARIDSAVAMKEDTLAMLQNSGAATGEIQLLEQQIALLKERGALLQQGNATADLTREAMENQRVMRDLGDAVAHGFEDAIVYGDGLRDVLDGIEKDILRILTRKLISEPISDGITGILKGGGGDFFSSLLGGLFGGGRANGGPVSAGGMYEVNERGIPELLNVAGRQFLMMGNQGGSVTPQAPQQQVSRPITINVQMPQGATRDTGMQFGAGIARQLAMADARNN